MRASCSTLQRYTIESIPSLLKSGETVIRHLERESEIRDVPFVGFEESERLRIRGALHGGGPNIQ
jgi:hypothetical protein